MIVINKHTLANGLRMLHHYDGSTQMVALNIVYRVGSRDEDPSRTGFAHLFEHLMFGGSVNIPDFDGPLQEAGGENNAWTSNDITNYYSVVPRQNVETAFWLESDRMLGLEFSEKSLNVQKQVVMEEFKQRNLNQPYGDIPMLIRPLAYKVHPYQWATIGKELSHIEQATLDDVRDFYFGHYSPDNAILSISGNIPFDEALELTEKWFGPISARPSVRPVIPVEPLQTAPRFLEVERRVPSDALMKAYHICARNDRNYYAYDLLSDILSGGRSARLFQELVMERKLFAEINAYVSGDLDAGLFFITGKPNPGVSLEEGDRAIVEIIDRLARGPISSYELKKMVNKFESNHLFTNLDYLSKATNIAYFELLGQADDINIESDKYKNLTPEDIRSAVATALTADNCSTLYYRAVND